MAQHSSKKSSSTPLRQPRNRCDSGSPSTPSCRSSLRKLHVHENVENNNVKSTKSSSTNSRNATNGKGGETTVSSPVGSSCPSVLLLEPRIGRQTRRSSGSSSSSSQTTSATTTTTTTTLIPCINSLPVIEENTRSRLLRKSPRTSITKPKLSPRKDVMMSPLRPPPPPSSLRNHHHATHTTMDVIEEESTRLRKSPRRSSFTKQPMLSPKKGPISPLLPPRTLRSITDASYFNDFTTTLTPIILYGDNNYKGRRGGGEHNNLHPHPPQSAPPISHNQQQQHYHQSPHWSGQVRINPFSPIPEQYLRPPPPPSSIKSVTRESRKRSHHSCFYGGLVNINHDNNNARDIGAEEEGGPPTLPMEMMMASLEHPPLPQAKKARFHNSSIILPRCASQVVVVPGISSTSTSSVLPRFDENEISPTDVMMQPPMMRNIGLEGSGGSDGRKSLPPPLMDLNECTNGRTTNNNNNIHTANTTNNNNRMPPVKRGRYLDDFQEVQFLGAGSFGSVYACLSRLDGCMYAVKSISPTGRSSLALSSNKKGGSDDRMCGQDDGEGGGGVGTIGGTTIPQYLYGKGPNSMLSSAAPRRDLPPSPQRRKKSFSRLGGIGLEENNNSTVDDDDDRYNLDVLEGSRHWNESALRRVLREVFALAALCQQDDFRTFHVVRYQQAWLEGDGTLYIQTELCTSTLRDEMVSGSMDALPTKSSEGGAITVGGHSQGITVFRQLKILREVLLALELVHQQGMVHLDIKPENIFVKNNLFKLGDFGLANAFTTNGEITSVADIEEGDSRYMSKDLLESNRPKDLTKCDIFSLGATLYEVCSRQPLPSCGQDWQDLRHGKLPLIPGTMPSLNGIIKEMMHPNPDKRPSATELLSRDTLGATHETSASYKVGPQAQPTQPHLTRSASWT